MKRKKIICCFLLAFFFVMTVTPLFIYLRVLRAMNLSAHGVLNFIQLNLAICTIYHIQNQALAFIFIGIYSHFTI